MLPNTFEITLRLPLVDAFIQIINFFLAVCIAVNRAKRLWVQLPGTTEPQEHDIDLNIYKYYYVYIIHLCIHSWLLSFQFIIANYKYNICCCCCNYYYVVVVFIYTHTRHTAHIHSTYIIQICVNIMWVW